MNQKIKIDSILPLVRKPGRYIGGELNAVHPDFNKADLSFALIFPDLYEIGMSHQGLQILYQVINQEPGLVAERCYAPDVDMEEQLRANDLPLFSIESRRPLADFDIIGITLPYELCYTNILTILDLGRIPLRATDRAEDHPLVMAGGSCALNPEPVADFFDVVVMGDGEEVVLEIADTVRAGKAEQCSRQDILHRLATIDGVYIPRFFEPQYEGQQLTAVTPLVDNYTTVNRRVLPELPPVELLTQPLVPLVKPIHDRLAVEIARGCTRGCRFCQAGVIYRPVRERSVDDIMQLAEQGIANSGFDELALLSLSSGDFSCLPALLIKLMDRFADEYVSVSMPSMRVGTLTPEVINQIKRVRKTGFTVAPEAGTDRLREVINKGITEQDLLTTCRDAFAAGWNLIKFYFMIGLPTETWEDVENIVELVKKAKQAGEQAGVGRRQINVSVGTFVPKPHTPFQWEPQLRIEESHERIQRLKQLLPRKGFKLKWHDPKQSYLEGVFSRGDRRLAKLLICAWKNGAGLDSWSDHFNLAIWQESAKQCEIDLDSYLRKREMSETLPWHHLHSGVDLDFLKNELERAHQLHYTPDCRYHSCQKCGLCDFKTIKPVVIDRKQNRDEETENKKQIQQTPVISTKPRQGEEQHFRYTVTYSRMGDICYLGHLEILQIVFRILRRAEIRTNFSKGFNPSPKVSFGPAMPVGTQSLAEYFIMDLPAPLDNLEDAKARLNKQMPPGLTVQEITLSNGNVPQEVISSYRITLHPPLSDNDTALMEKFLTTESFTVKRVRKGKVKEIDFRPLVVTLEVIDNTTVSLELISKASQAGVKPLEAVAAILQKNQEELLASVVIKTDWKEL